jgi:hypothetical protein
MNSYEVWDVSLGKHPAIVSINKEHPWFGVVSLCFHLSLGAICHFSMRAKLEGNCILGVRTRAETATGSLN